MRSGMIGSLSATISPTASTAEIRAARSDASQASGVFFSRTMLRLAASATIAGPDMDRSPLTAPIPAAYARFICPDSLASKRKGQSASVRFSGGGAGSFWGGQFGNDWFGTRTGGLHGGNEPDPVDNAADDRGDHDNTRENQFAFEKPA